MHSHCRRALGQIISGTLDSPSFDVETGRSSSHDALSNSCSHLEMKRVAFTATASVTTCGQVCILCVSGSRSEPLKRTQTMPGFLQLVSPPPKLRSCWSTNFRRSLVLLYFSVPKSHYHNGPLTESRCICCCCAWSARSGCTSTERRSRWWQQRWWGTGQAPRAGSCQTPYSSHQTQQHSDPQADSGYSIEASCNSSDEIYWSRLQER